MRLAARRFAVVTFLCSGCTAVLDFDGHTTESNDDGGTRVDAAADDAAVGDAAVDSGALDATSHDGSAEDATAQDAFAEDAQIPDGAGTDAQPPLPCDDQHITVPAPITAGEESLITVFHPAIGLTNVGWTIDPTTVQVGGIMFVPPQFTWTTLITFQTPGEYSLAFFSDQEPDFECTVRVVPP